MMHCFSIRSNAVSCEDMDAQHVISSNASTQDASSAKVLDSTTHKIDSEKCTNSRTKTTTTKGSESSMVSEQTSKLGARYFSVGMNPGALLWCRLNKDEVLNWVVVVGSWWMIFLCGHKKQSSEWLEKYMCFTYLPPPFTSLSLCLCIWIWLLSLTFFSHSNIGNVSKKIVVKVRHDPPRREPRQWHQVYGYLCAY